MNSLKRILAVILILGIIIPSEAFHFVASVPAIVGHYYHHTEDHGESIGFFKYLADHLSEKGDHHTEHGKDHESPFHHHHNLFCNLQLIAPPAQLFDVNVPQDLSNEKLKIRSQKDFHPSDCLSSIWQPPKFS